MHLNTTRKGIRVAIALLFVAGVFGCGYRSGSDGTPAAVTPRVEENGLAPGNPVRVDGDSIGFQDSSSLRQPESLRVADDDALLLPTRSSVRPVFPHDDTIGELSGGERSEELRNAVVRASEFLDRLHNGDVAEELIRADGRDRLLRRLEFAQSSDVIHDRYRVGRARFTSADVDDTEVIVPVRLFRGSASTDGTIVLSVEDRGVRIVDVRVDFLDLEDDV